MISQRTVRKTAGFTLIELLVVVLIIGILASIAIPQYFKVVERARIAEGHTFVSQLKQAQERYLARQGNYIQTNANVGLLDVNFSGTSPTFGMKFFTATIGAGSGTGCAAGDPRYNITMARVTTTGVGLASRYGTGYNMVFERCSGAITYPGCANCLIDFAQ